ncbi:transcriptional regulator [Candidatus Saccharibacteria bacterium]|nr:transcriptional regulator [Candidatus Saccharibacteria bacterium]
MVEQLFGSKTRVKLLQLFYTNPNRSFYVREITRQIDEQINSVRRELANLLSVGIIVSDNANNRLYYEVNQKYEHYDAFHSIFGGGVVKRKKAKKGEEVKEEVVVAEPADELKALGNVELALYSGQFTRDETAGIDFLLVGDVNMKALENYVSELEKKEGKDIRYAVMTTDNFTYRRQINDRFIIKVLEAKKQILVDKHNLLEGK